MGIDGLQGCQLFPERIPDLFVGGPLVIAGKYTGNFPKTITLSGLYPNGHQLDLQVSVGNSNIVPVGKVFVKKQLDQLIATEWLDGDQKVRDNIVDISLNE